MTAAMLEALALIGTPRGLLLLTTAVAIGTVVAILPGIGSPVAMALILPATIVLEPFEAVMFLVSIMAAGGFAGSITAILISVPGDETNAATVLDGHQLARQGRAGEAIGASATASALGAIIGVLILIASLPILRTLVLILGPGEIFALALTGVLMIGSISTGNVLRGVIAGLLGMAVGLIGFNYAVGGTRFAFGVVRLFDGVPLVPALVGLFAIPEVIKLLRDPSKSISQTGTLVAGGVGRGVKAVLTRPLLLLRSSVIGTGLGMVPGVGGSIANWISYYAAARTSKHPEKFGTGVIEGVIAPEAAIDSKDGGQLMPLLALGIPGGVTTAILASGFLTHGINPGTSMFTTNLNIVFVMVFTILAANIVTSALGLVAANWLIKITLVPVRVIAPVVIVLSMIGGYASAQSLFGVVVVLVMGGLGWLMVGGGYSRPAFVIGLILVPLIEQNFHVARQVSRGTLGFLTDPLVATLLGVGLLLTTGPSLMRAIRKLFASSDPADDVDAPDEAAGTSAGPPARGDDPGTGRVEAQQRPAGSSSLALSVKESSKTASRGPGFDPSDSAPSQELLVAALATAVSGLMLYGSLQLTPDQRLFPVGLLPLLLVLSLSQFVFSIVRWRRRSGPRAGWSQMGALVWVALMPLLMWLFGVIPATFLFTVIFGLAYGGISKPPLKRTLTVVAAAMILAASVHYIFVVGLSFRFAPGFLV